MEAMEASMEQAQSGDLLPWFTGPALTGALLHMMAGMTSGALFGLLVAVMRIPRAFVVPTGVAFGISVMVVMSFVVLPVMASLFGSGDPIRNMPSMVGWATFTAEHALFGLVVGVMALNLGTRTIDVTFGAHEGGGQSTGRGTHERVT
jgi:Na+/citrate or Na+/malate symporter